MARQPSPFQQHETLTIKEGMPLFDAGRTGLRAIHLRRGDGRRRSDAPKVDAAGIVAISDAIALVAASNVIELLSIDEDSALPGMPSIAPLSHLGYLFIEARDIRDYGGIGFPSTLTHLYAVNYREDSLRRFTGCRLAFVRLIAGNVRRFDVAAGQVLLQGLRALEGFESVGVRYLTLEGCNKVDLDSLSNVVGLRTLEILSRKTLVSLDFVARCRDLEKLVITATPRLSSLDMQGVVDAPALRKVFLAVNSDVIAGLARRAPHLIVTNGSVCYAGTVLQANLSMFYSG